MLPANFPYRKESKRKEAKERYEAFNALSVTERIQLLDKRLGAGVGAVKQRARLQKLLTAKPAAVPTIEETSVVTQPTEQVVEEAATKRKKKTSAKERRAKNL